MSIVFVSALLLASIAPSWAFAQSSSDTWTEPVNLSNSGFALKPAFVVDSDGIGHAIWQDDLDRYLYARFDGKQWSTPKKTDLNTILGLATPRVTNPDQAVVYRGPNPLFIAAPEQQVFAFWISHHGDLFVSAGDSPKFEELSAWDKRRLITSDAASFAATIDTSGESHVAFLRMDVVDPARPAGIYYTRSSNHGSSWSAPVLLYESPYLHTLGEGEGNLSIATAGTEDALRVYVAWDNRPRKQVFLTQSTDGGETWKQPKVVAGPTPSAASDAPFNILVGTSQNSVVVVWQSGRVEGTCSQLYQFSSDAGVTWSETQSLIDELAGCEQSNEFVRGMASGSRASLYLMTATKSQVYLSAWSGEQWSQPQAQPILSGFAEPEIYTEVKYRCRQTYVFRARLYVVGCDEREGGDVWATSRDLGSSASGLEPPVWAPLSSVLSDNLEIQAMDLVSTEDGLIHAFFSQRGDPDVYYTNWNGELWSREARVLKLPDGQPGVPVVAAGPGNELFLIVHNSMGTLYFSRAISSGAVLASSWSTPTRLETEYDGKIGSVDITQDAAGTLYVAYSIPVNDKRGIYLVSSKDQGATWSAPVQLFDGAAAGFDLVGAPSLQASTGGLLHVMWNVQSIQGDGVSAPLSLYYARSLDGGRTFNPVQLAVEEPVAWREILLDDKGNLHLLWQPQNTLTTVWDQVSSDGGATWEHPHGLPTEGMLATVTRDPAGRLHAVTAGQGLLHHWLWDNSAWKAEAPLGLPLTSQQGNPAALLTAVVNKDGKMMVVLAKATGEGNTFERSLLYSTRTLKLPAKPTVDQESLVATELIPTTTPITSTPEVLVTSTGTVEGEPTLSGVQKDLNSTGTGISPFTVALFPVALLLLGVLGIFVRQVVRAKD